MTARSLALALSVGLTFALGAHAQKPPKPKRGGKEAPAAQSAPGEITLRVVEVAGGRAYVEPGADAGLRAGDSVLFGKRKYAVVASSKSFAVLELGKFPLQLGATGTATLDPNRAPEVVQPPPAPPPLAQYRGTWQRPTLPAATQHPTPVPLGTIAREERNALKLTAAGYGVVPTSDGAGAFASSELRAELHVEPIVELPLAFDADLSIEGWHGLSNRAGGSSRPLVRVRELAATMGQEAGFLAAFGRLRYASSTLGTLDGLKLRAPIAGGLSIGAFGGYVAHPLSGEPATDASRFGGELAWEDTHGELRPSAVLGGHLSRFDGEIDERRVTALVDVNPSFGRFGSWAEVSFFDRDNPWNADPTELTGAGADADVRAGIAAFGARVAMQRPERSRHLASLLPPEWLCITRPSATQPEACLGGDAVYVASADAGLRFEKTSLTIGATGSRTDNENVENAGGFGNVRLLDIVGKLRFDAGAMATRGSLLDSASLTLSPGVEVFDGTGDVSVRWRPALIRFRADTETRTEHTLGGSLWWSPSRAFDLLVDADYVTGLGLDALILQGALVWRTGF